MSIAEGLSPPDPKSIAGDAEWLPASFDGGGETIGFLHVPRELHRAVPFLGEKYLREAAAPPSARAAAAPLRAALPMAGNGPHFIFHSAFCCSTLLARALDIHGRSLGLKEPTILNDLAALHRAGTLAERDLLLVLALLGRPLAAGETIVIKPSNEANILIETILTLCPGAHALLLHAPLPSFLRSLAKKGLWGRNWGRRLYALLARDGGRRFGFSDAEIFEQTDLQIAALAWLIQQRQFADLARLMPARVRTLDSETLLADPAGVMAGAAALFGFDLPAAEAERIAAGPAFSQHAKQIGRGYDSTARAAEQAAVQAAHEEEIDMVCQWAAAVARHGGIQLTLPLPLLAGR